MISYSKFANITESEEMQNKPVSMQECATVHLIIFILLWTVLPLQVSVLGSGKHPSEYGIHI